MKLHLVGQTAAKQLLAQRIRHITCCWMGNKEHNRLFMAMQLLPIDCTSSTSHSTHITS